MSKAKIASKNDPSTRQKAREFFYNEKKVKPVLFVGSDVKYMAVAYEDGNMVEGVGNMPLAWSDLAE
jgi:hypothetical protein